MDREVILDTETTGLDPFSGHKVIEIGCVEIINKITTGNNFQVYINPERDVPQEAFRIHGISGEFLKDKPKFREIANDFLSYIGNSKLIIHNAQFDLKFLNYELGQLNIKPLDKANVIDTLTMARKKFPGSPANLDALCRRFNVNISHRTNHGALLDSELLAEIYLHLTDQDQPKMQMEQKTITIEESNEIISRKPIKRSRNFVLSEDDLLAHKNFMEKLDAEAF